MGQGFFLAIVGTRLIVEIEHGPAPGIGDHVALAGGVCLVRWRSFAYETKHGTVVTVGVEPCDEEDRWPDEWRRSRADVRRGRGGWGTSPTAQRAGGTRIPF